MVNEEQKWPLADKVDVPVRAEIMVVGAYKGLTMQFLAHKFPTFKRILGFEPQEWAAREARQRFQKDQLEGIWVINYALGDESRGLMAKINIQEFGTNACSLFKKSQIPSVEVLITEAASVLPLFYPEGQIDLCVMNCEGSEFELLPHFERTGWLNRIERLAVHWHPDISSSLTKKEMNRQITILKKSGFTTKVDERPSWTYHVR